MWTMNVPYPAASGALWKKRAKVIMKPTELPPAALPTNIDIRIIIRQGSKQNEGKLTYGRAKIPLQHLQQVSGRRGLW